MLNRSRSPLWSDDKLHAPNTKDWDKNLHMGLLFPQRRDPAAQSNSVHILKDPNCNDSATSICALSIKCIMLHV